MGAKTNIEWTRSEDGTPGSTWTPVRARNLATGKVGWHCEHVSEGCRFCYSESMNRRLGTGLDFKPGHRADIEVFLDEKMLLAPLRWKTPRRIFVNSMTDTFAEFVKDEWLDRMFAVMACAGNHTFQVLTKRPERMHGYMGALTRERIQAASYIISRCVQFEGRWLFDLPLPNCWLGVSAEDQATADERIPLLLQAPAAVRFVSLEPLLGPIDLEAMPFPDGDRRHHWSALTGQALMYAEGINGNPDITIRMEKPLRNKIDWAIVGGESGAHARPMHPDWARSLRDQCAAADVPYFFKQWGEWAPALDREGVVRSEGHGSHGAFFDDGKWTTFVRGDHHGDVFRLGKKAAGRLLDGVEHNGMPT